MSDEPGSRSGSMFGPYRLVRPLGKGGMGEVYEAEHTVKGWTVAVKLMSESVSKDPVFRERMKREARIAGRLQEPHVVPIHDYGEIDGQMFLEMRLIEGTDLDHLLKRYGPLPPPRAVAIITQIASALDAAHAAGVMHRDVKPPNILVTRDDFAYLVDFGIASASTDEKLTQLGTAVGTWKYMAPERFTNDEVTFSADIYSLACVLYECLTGTAPYPSDNAGVLVSAHMMDPVPKPSTTRSDVPRALDAVIAIGMAKKPPQRYAGVSDLARAAHEALSTPDRNQASTILRRSQETALPAQFLEPKTVQHQPPPADPGPTRPVPQGPSGPIPQQRSGPIGAPPQGPSGPIPQAPGPGGPPLWVPASGGIPVANQQLPRATPPGPWNSGMPPGPPPGAPPFMPGGTPPTGPPPQPFAGQMPWAPGYPPAPPRSRNIWWIAGAAAVVLIVLLGVVGIWAGSGDDDSTQAEARRTTSTTRTTPTPTTTTTRTTLPSTSPPPAAQAKLMSLVPPGYPSGACTPESKPMPGSLISVTCTQNTDANGPKVSAYGVYADVAGLKSAFAGFIKTFTIQSCPGGGASPGNWWKKKDPATILGQIACGIYKGTDPQVMWSNEQTLMFGLVAGQPPTLDQLYTWWSTHS